MIEESTTIEPSVFIVEDSRVLQVVSSSTDKSPLIDAAQIQGIKRINIIISFCKDLAENFGNW